MSRYNLLFVVVILNFYAVDFINGYQYDSPNVKTALFNELDVMRACWSRDEINLLRARMIMQDLVPRKVPKDLPYLVEYLRSAEEAVVKHSPDSRVRRIMMLALSDVLGAYLQAVAIPMAKENYYAGNIDYATMSQLHETLGEMKRRLRTDGGRWSRPVDMAAFPVRVTALHLPADNSELACKAVIVAAAESCAEGQPRIAVPYLDYDRRPAAVALPLKSRNLYSLKTAASSHIIVRFYILARQCLAGMPPRETEVFNYHFVRWLTTKVVPKLYEDEWYPGFGSVMRIVETVNETELLRHMEPYYASNDSSLEKALSAGSCGLVGAVTELARYHTLWLVAAGVVALTLLGSLVCCCWFAIKGGGGLGRSSSASLLHAVLSFYFGLKDDTDAAPASAPGAPRDSGASGGPVGRRPRPVYESSSPVPTDTSSDDESDVSSEQS